MTTEQAPLPTAPLPFYADTMTLQYAEVTTVEPGPDSPPPPMPDLPTEKPDWYQEVPTVHPRSIISFDDLIKATDTVPAV